MLANRLAHQITINSVKPSVLIVGAGAVGLTYAYHLKDHARLGVVARSNHDEIKNLGIRIRPGTKEVRTFHPSVLIRDSEKETSDAAEPFDFIIVASKTNGTDAIGGLSKYLGPNSLLLLAQNGVGIEKPYLEKYSNITICSGSILVASGVESGSLVNYFNEHMGVKAGIVGGPDLEIATRNLEKLSALSNQSGIDFVVSQNIRAERWQKLLWNGTYNTLCSILDTSPKVLYEAGLKPLFAEMMEEIWTIAGADLDDENWAPKTVITDTINNTESWSKVHSGFVPSTLQDVRKGKEIEVEGLLGYAMKVADKNQIPCPNLKLVYNLLQVMNFKRKNNNQQ